LKNLKQNFFSSLNQILNKKQIQKIQYKKYRKYSFNEREQRSSTTSTQLNPADKKKIEKWLPGLNNYFITGKIQILTLKYWIEFKGDGAEK